MTNDSKLPSPTQEVDTSPEAESASTPPNLFEFLPTNPHPEQLLTTEQLVAITGISRVTFEGWRSRKDKDGNLKGGGPKATKLGPQIVRYRWADYLIWRDQNTATESAA